jgi:hypothetical protein
VFGLERYKKLQDKWNMTDQDFLTLQLHTLNNDKLLQLVKEGVWRQMGRKSNRSFKLNA